MNDCGNVTINLETNELIIHSETDEINPRIDFLRFNQIGDIYEIIDNYKKFGYVIVSHNFLSEYTYKDGFNILCSFDNGNLHWNKYSAS
jgi:hypothetical protein